MCVRALHLAPAQTPARTSQPCTRLLLNCRFPGAILMLQYATISLILSRLFTMGGTCAILLAGQVSHSGHHALQRARTP